jgi:hypothetical protein
MAMASGSQRRGEMEALVVQVSPKAIGLWLGSAYNPRPAEKEWNALNRLSTCGL